MMSPLKKALFVEPQPVYGGFWRKKSSLNHHIWVSPIENNLLSVESDDALEMTLDFLGDYDVISDGIFRSKNAIDFDADGNPIFALVHMLDDDLLGKHGRGPHINFELARFDGNGRWTHLQNRHIYLTDP